MDVRVPRLSWQLASDVRGQRQTAFRVIVARSREALEKNSAEFWDSGKVDSDQSFLVPYNGKALSSHDDCYWKVMIWDKDGVSSAWSSTARFSVGLLDESDWSGSWIHSPSAKPEEHVWFRRTLTLEQKPETSFCYVASIGYHQLYVNGQRVGDSMLEPSLTRLDKRVAYVTYDITSLLKKGSNVIAVWEGPGWARMSFYKTSPALKLQLQVNHANGQSTSLHTDAQWYCKASYSSDTGQRKYRDHGGEQIDMKRMDPQWNVAGRVGDDWERVTETKKKVILSAQMVQPNRVIQTLTPVSIKGTNPCTIDMGINYTGMMNIKIPRGVGSDRVAIKIADDPDGGSKRKPDGQDFGQINILKCNADGSGHFINRFNYVSGRYITVEGLKQPLRKEDVTVYVVATDFKQKGRFECSNELFNQIYETDLWTYRANTLEGLTMDCPHRERLGYGEVAYATAWGIGLPNYDSAAFYAHNVQSWCDAQEENGWIHHTAPQINRHFGGPMWSSAPVNIAWEHYKQFGDVRILERVYPTGVRWVNFLQEHVMDGLLTNYSKNKHGGHFLGDWAAPGGRKEFGTSPEALYFNNCTYLMVLQKMKHFADKLEKTEDATRYQAEADALKVAIHKRYFNAAAASYMNGTQPQLAFALWLGIPPSKQRATVYETFVAAMKKKPVMLDMGSSGLPVLLSYCIDDAECNDLLFPALKSEDQPSYGYFIKRGESTWPEYWSVDVPSKIHTCYTGIASWFTKGIAGIRPDFEKPGMKQFIIKPHLIGDLSSALAEAPSPYGVIKAAWKKDPNGVILQVSVPPNSEATVYIPSSDVKKITEGDAPISKSKGVTFLRQEGNRSIVHLQSGNYTFMVSAK